MTDKRFNIEAPSVTQHEATVLCVYHLRLAAMYFEAVADDLNVSLKTEIHRQCAGDDATMQAAFAWAERILKHYEALKENHGHN